VYLYSAPKFGAAMAVISAPRYLPHWAGFLLNSYCVTARVARAPSR